MKTRLLFPLAFVIIPTHFPWPVSAISLISLMLPPMSCGDHGWGREGYTMPKVMMESESQESSQGIKVPLPQLDAEEIKFT